MPFNEGQLKAIQQRNASILVSAPAGSGKTKILVTRIIELLKEGYDIFDFLVLTFTEAAGNEMKQRLSEELNLLASSPIDSQLKKHLEKQILNLPHAYITNFHGFCNLLLMKYGYLVNVMPGFEINSDPTMIKKEVLQDCLEQWVQDKQISQFLELYFPGYSLESFENILLSIDNLSHSIHDFYGFIEQIKQTNYDSLSTSLETWPLFPELIKIFQDEISLAQNKLSELKYFCETNNLSDFYDRPDEQTEKNQELYIPFEAYFDYLEERRKFLLLPSFTFDSFSQLMHTPVPKAYNMNWKEVDPEIKSQFTKLKTNILSSFNNAIQSFIPENVDDFISKMKLSYEAIDLLVGKHHLLDQFQHAYQLRKKQLNQLDFADLEKYAHQLLEPQYGIADILYHRLKEIMVDEYQDTNQIQETLLMKISRYQEPEIPIFMVGDMKQSIYRFRQADPQLFYHKYSHFSLTDEESQKTHQRRIDLVFNYRSSKIVLDSINYIFNQIMNKEIGGLEYYLDESARLNYDYDGKENGKKQEARERFFQQKELTTEVLIDIYNPKSHLDKEQYEAHMVAQKIIKLKQEMKLNGKAVEYKDIVILMRSTTAFLTFKKVFDLYNIPNHIVLSQGLMNSNEVINMITFLKAINNPKDDVALLSILRLPYTISHIDLETIAAIRCHQKDISLYESLQTSSHPQIIKFLDDFQELKNYSYSHSPYELLQKIYEVTDYPLFVSQLINGVQRKANLDLLLEIVNQIQSHTPYLGDLIEALEKSSDYAPAQASSGSTNVVEFMTIHKSKGLEFPIVFVSNMHKLFNTQDSKERLIIDKYLGIALKPRISKSNEDLHNICVEYENCYRNMIARHQLEESINEEMRILYVALTRASQKLILTGVIKSIDEIVDIQQKLLVNESPDILHNPQSKTIILYNRLRKTNNYLSWVLAAILRHPDIIQQCLQHDALRKNAQQLQYYHFDKVMNNDSTEHAMFSLILTDDQTIEENIPKREQTTYHIDSNQQEYYYQFEYPYDIYQPQKVSVTQLSKIKDDHYQSHLEQDNFSVDAASQGTLVHLLLSYLTFKNDNIQEIINQMTNEQLIDNEGQTVLVQYQDKLNNFIQSDIYQQIKKADYVYKEKPFSYYDEDLKQIVHGIFDLVFIINNEVYVLDYKTDRVSLHSDEQKLINKHKDQLTYYQKVLQQMYHYPTHALVYYLHISKLIQL